MLDEWMMYAMSLVFFIGVMSLALISLFMLCMFVYSVFELLRDRKNR